MERRVGSRGLLLLVAEVGAAAALTFAALSVAVADELEEEEEVLLSSRTRGLDSKVRVR